MSPKELRLVALLGWQDIRQRYRRSALGQFWITISIGVMVICLAVLFGKLFQSPLETFLPFLAIGLICWNFISSTVTEGCSAFTAAEGIIKQLNVPLRVHVMRVIWRNLIIFMHNLVIIPLVFLSLGIRVGWEVLLFIPGLLLLTANLAWVCMVLGIVCTRFRDLPQVVQSILQVAFYLTPIIWLPELLKNKSEHVLVEGNPLYHLVELLRAPLLGQAPTATNWAVSLVMLGVGVLLALMVSRRLGYRVAYWL